MDGIVTADGTSDASPREAPGGALESGRRKPSYVSIFSGIEAASVAWGPLGWKPLCFSEVDEFPSAVLAARYPSVPNLGDITAIDWEDAVRRYGKPDVVIGGSPCFPAGTMVTTLDGNVGIEDVREGDLVLTHRGRFRRVLSTGSRVADTITLHGRGTAGIECTPNHPFYAATGTGDASSARGTHAAGDARGGMVEAEWVRADNMPGRMWLRVCHAGTRPDHAGDDAADDADRRIASRALVDGEDPSEALMYVAGHWLADGALRRKGTDGDAGAGKGTLIMRLSDDERERLAGMAGADGLGIAACDDGTLAITSATASDWVVDRFGAAPGGRNVPGWCLCLGERLRDALFHGYADEAGRQEANHVAGDAHDNAEATTRCRARTGSRALAVGMAQLAGSLGHVVGMAAETGAVGGSVTYASTYEAASGRDGAPRCDIGVWSRVDGVGAGRHGVTVHNLEVDGDHSYLADGIAVHNCQSFSVAGKREGLRGASGLMYEYIRAIQEIRPGILLWENVPGAFSSEHGKAFGQLLSSLDDLGYGLAWRVLDSEFWGVAQRRRRVFVVGCLGDPERAAEVLFDSPSLYRDPEPGRRKREELARRAGARADGAGHEERDGDARTTGVYALQSDGGTSQHGNGSAWNDTGAAYTLNTVDRQSVAYSCKAVAVNQRSEVRYDGGDGETVGAIPAHPGGKQMQCVIEAHGSGTDPDVVGALCASDAKQIGNQYVSQGKVIIETRNATGNAQATRRQCASDEGDADARAEGHAGDNTTDGDARQAAGDAIVMASGQAHAERCVGMAPTLAARQYKDPPVLFVPSQGGYDDADDGAGDGTSYVVRRLMPVETERLQGFPDGWTDLTGEDADAIATRLLNGPFSGYDAKTSARLSRNVRRWCADCPDGKRYKATGNSMAVPVIRWIGERIEQTTETHTTAR